MNTVVSHALLALDEGEEVRLMSPPSKRQN